MSGCRSHLRLLGGRVGLPRVAQPRSGQNEISGGRRSATDTNLTARHRQMTDPRTMANTAPRRTSRASRAPLSRNLRSRQRSLTSRDLRACRGRMGYMRIARAALLAPVIAFADTHARVHRQGHSGSPAPGRCAARRNSCRRRSRSQPAAWPTGSRQTAASSRISPLTEPVPARRGLVSRDRHLVQDRAHASGGRTRTHALWRSHEQIAANQIGARSGQPKRSRVSARPQALHRAARRRRAARRKPRATARMDHRRTVHVLLPPP